MRADIPVAILIRVSSSRQKNLSRQFVAIGQFQKFAGDTPAATVKRLGAVSSVVEHLVYTERVGGSKPSPPILLERATPLLLIQLVFGQPGFLPGP
jgi:hypothetical protein